MGTFQKNLPLHHCGGESDGRKNADDEIFCELRSDYKHSKQKMLPNLPNHLS